MTPERWQRLEEVYYAVVDQPAADRSEFLARLCGDDSQLLEEVESLLAHESAATAFLEQGVSVDVLADEQCLTGRQAGSYLIGPLLGAGAMGEVHRAHDAQLGRDVALKILPRLFWNDPDRRDRFEREARILAALNHPNIGAIYGHVDVDDSPALVLELVDGETLAERMTRPMPLAEALAVARAIAEALEAAHERGIIHRDLKPANIKLTPDGVVKVLDFGLAKLAAEDSGAAGSGTHEPQSPSTKVGTRDGALVGTPAYMSPEQAAGKVADKRSDIWAFGVIVLEMLTGRPVFAGDTDAQVIAAVMETQPDLGLLPPQTPVSIHKLLRRCLEKDRKRRLDSAGAARWEIDDALDTPVPVNGLRARTMRRFRWTVALLVVGGAAAVLVTGRAIFMSPLPETLPSPSRFAIVTPPSRPLNVASNDRDLVLSPDGRYLVYRAIGSTTNGSALFLRALDRLDAVPISDIDNAYTPFFSPDSRWVAFFERGMLKKVSVTGGPVVTLGPVAGDPLGASWGDDNTIVFGTDDPHTGLWRIPANGGEPTVVTRPDVAAPHRDHAFPSVLPGSRGVLFTITAAGQPAKAEVAWIDLKTGERKSLVGGGHHAEFLEPPARTGRGGYLIYAAEGALRAVRFDPNKMAVVGDSSVLVDRVMIKSNGAANYAVSQNGTLVYVPEGAATPTPITTLTWVDRFGREEAVDAPPRAYGPPRLSPDGLHVAVGFPDQGDTEIWILDLARAVQRRLTFSPGMDGLPIWSKDGRRIVFMSARGGALNWYTMRADGGGAVDQVTTSPTHEWPISISPGGDRVFGFDIAPTSIRRVISSTLPTDGRSPPTPQRVQGLFPGVFPEVSPNGRYIAYQSDESGREEIYVRPFPAVNHGRWQISTGGGTRAAWSRNGRELFYLDVSNRLHAVPTDTSGRTLVVGKPVEVFDAKYVEPNPARHYDVSPDGRRFLVLKPRVPDPNATPATMVIIERWFEELKTRVP